MKIYPTNTNITYTAVATTVGSPANTFTYSWTFGDGSASQTGGSILKAWSAEGTANATVLAVDRITGSSATATNTISLGNPNAKWLGSVMSAYIIGDYLYRYNQSAGMVQKMNLKTAAGVRFTWVDHAKFTAPGSRLRFFIAGSSIYIAYTPSSLSTTLYQIIGTDTVNNTNSVVVSSISVSALSGYDAGVGPSTGVSGPTHLKAITQDGVTTNGVSDNSSVAPASIPNAVGSYDSGSKTSTNYLTPVSISITTSGVVKKLAVTSTISKSWSPHYLYPTPGNPLTNTYVDDCSGTWGFACDYGTWSSSSTVTGRALTASTYTADFSATGTEILTPPSARNTLNTNPTNGNVMQLDGYTSSRTNYAVYPQFPQTYVDVILPFYSVNSTATSAAATPSTDFPSSGVYNNQGPFAAKKSTFFHSDGTINALVATGVAPNCVAAIYRNNKYYTVIDDLSGNTVIGMMDTPGANPTTSYTITMPPCAYVDGSGNIYTMNQETDVNGIYISVFKNGVLVQSLYDGTQLYPSPGDFLL